MSNSQKISSQIPEDYEGLRLDKALSLLFPDYSRSTIQKWLKTALVSVDDEILPQKQKVQGGEVIEIELPEQSINQALAEKIDLDVLHQDSEIIVLNKPAGLVVHPGAGNPSGTLMNGLLYFDCALFDLPRAGIVHRLDKDTSGLMVIARSEASRLNLIDQLQTRDVSRQYLTVVSGVPISGGTIEAAISRHPLDRRKMNVNSTGKEAISRYRVVEKYADHALLKVKLETGRTHQIRVHMQHIGYPVFGDPVYGRRLTIPKGADSDLTILLRNFKRQALHATKLSFIHPKTNESMSFTLQPPEDMQQLINTLSQT